MPDIFISYSSKDREQAQMLTELLASAGLSVWIDQAGIEAATSWSEEIVNALDGCKAFIVMLSPSSIESKNVVREVALAFEKNKKILPLDLEPVSLPASMQYHLAGLQRTSMTNIDSVIRALGKLGLEATGAPQAPKIVKETDGRKSLMILPFEDLSPTGDNGWFADGIVSELINALSNVKQLRLADTQATKEFKGYKGQLATYAREMSIRYFLQGDIRKFGDQIKISIRLLDIETGDYLWQDTLKGIMDDIFDIQEKVAEKVVEGLKVHLASDEKKKLAERGTQSAEAYEYYLRGHEFNDLHTQDGYRQSVAFYDLAIQLDSNFFDAIRDKANALTQLYGGYQRDPKIIQEVEALLRTVETLSPGRWNTVSTLAHLYLYADRPEDAARANQEHIVRDDGSFESRSSLGYYSYHVKQYGKALEYYEGCLLQGDRRHVTLWNVMINARRAGNREALDRWSHEAILGHQKHLRLHPEDDMARYHLAAIYSWMKTPQLESVLLHLELLDAKPELDPFIQFCVGIVFAGCHLDERAFEAIRKATARGYRNVSLLTRAEFDHLRGTPDFEELKRKMEESHA